VLFVLILNNNRPTSNRQEAQLPERNSASAALMEGVG